MKKRRKLNLILIVFIVVLVLGLGYAYLTTTLSINGTTDVDSNTWNVFWDNVQVTSGSVTGNQVITAPTINQNKNSVSFHVRLKEPGEFYEFTVDAKNNGTIDAMVDTISTTDVPDYFSYTITYEDNVPIVENNLLSSNSTEKYKVRIEYKTDINPEDLPEEEESLILTFGIEYLQADSSAEPIRKTLFSRDPIQYIIGQSIPDATRYDSYQEAMAAYGERYFLKHIVSNNIEMETYVGFFLDDNAYYIRVDEEVNEGEISQYYESNKEILQNAFGSSYCSENTYDGKKSYDCDKDGIGTHACTDGYVYATNYGWGCYGKDGISNCGIY